MKGLILIRLGDYRLHY